jgi:hypothetical protein
VGKVEPVKTGDSTNGVKEPAPAPTPEPAPRSAASAAVQASDTPTVHVKPVAKPAVIGKAASDMPTLSHVVPVEDKVIGGSAGVPLADAISPYGHRTPQVDLMPADTRSGARFGLDDESPLPAVDEVPVGDTFAAPDQAWTPPAPRAALDPLTAPYEEVEGSAFGRTILPAEPDAQG